MRKGCLVGRAVIVRCQMCVGFLYSAIWALEFVLRGLFDVFAHHMIFMRKH